MNALTHSDTILEIRTGTIRFTIRRLSFAAAQEAPEWVSSLVIAGDDVKSIRVCGNDSPCSAVSGTGCHLKTPPLLFARSAYEIVVRSSGKETLSVRNRENAIRREKSRKTEAGRLLKGIVRFEQTADASVFEVCRNGKTALTVETAVYPEADALQNDCRALLADVADDLCASAFDRLKRSYSKRTSGSTSSDPEEILNAVFSGYLKAANVLAQKLQRKERFAALRRSVGDLLSDALRLLLQFRAIYAISLHCRDAVTQRTDETIAALRSLIRSLAPSGSRERRKENDLSSSSSDAHDYKELQKYHRLLQRGLAIRCDLFRFPRQDAAALYPYWCYFRLAGILEKYYALSSSGVIRKENDGITLALQRKRRAKVRFFDEENKTELTLAFYPRAAGSKAPDLLLTTKNSAFKRRRRYAFFAQFRLKDGQDSPLFEQPSGARSDEKSAVLPPVCLLIPYAHGETDEKGAGTSEALPFFPGTTAYVESLLAELSRPQEEPAGNAPLSPEEEEKIALTDWNKREVLIGSVRNEEQYKHCLEKKYYYVPAGSLPEDVSSIRCVAMALPKNGSDPGIRFYGNVTRTAKVKRGRIPFPMNRNNAEEEYRVFVVQSWTPLPKPIRPYDDPVYGPRFTNRFLLEHSGETYELFNVRSEEEYRLLAALKPFLQSDDTKEEPPYGALFRFADGCVLYAQRGSLLLSAPDGRTLASFTAQEARKSPKRLLKGISAARNPFRKTQTQTNRTE